jgi:hypothetical protein
MIVGGRHYGRLDYNGRGRAAEQIHYSTRAGACYSRHSDRPTVRECVAGIAPLFARLCEASRQVGSEARAENWRLTA